MVTTSTATGGGGGLSGGGVDEVSGRLWSAIHREANVQAQCMTWLFADFDLSWVVHGRPRSQVPCSGRDAMEVRRGQGHMQASLEENIHQQQHGIERVDPGANPPGILLCVLALIEGSALALI